MALIWTFSTPKGGAGKSTLACLIAGELASRDYRVTLMDCDTQQTTSTWFRESRERGFPMLNIDCLSINDPATLKSEALRLEPLRDYILIDLKGEDQGSLIPMAVSLAETMIIPCQVSMPDMTGALRLVNYLRANFQQNNVPPPEFRIVLNRVQLHDSQSALMIQMLAALNHFELAKPPLGVIDRPTYRELFLNNGTLQDRKPRDAKDAERLDKAKHNIAALIDRYLEPDASRDVQRNTWTPKLLEQEK